MSSCSTIHLTLPQWDGGSRKIRFIHLVDLTSFRLTENPTQSPVVPLYLGADLFSNTDIRTENHPRYHAKFARKGFATKIHFSSAFRFHGLKVPTVNNSLWFYSVQGLFRVAFEMYSKQEQLAVLENFQDVWKSQINASPLKVSYNLSVQLDSALSGSLQDTESRRERSQPQHAQVGRELLDAFGSGTGDTSADHDYCSFPKQSLLTEHSQQVVTTVRQKLHSLDDQLSSKTQSYTEELDTILLLLENIDRYINGNLDEKDVTETVLALLKAKDWGCVYSSSLLCGVGRWLGQQFHAANSSISQKVEGFKVQHIERISDLPPAEELASELFPEAMQTLLLHWMGLSEESTVEKRHSEYPILLLILEFANHNLITGKIFKMIPPPYPLSGSLQDTESEERSQPQHAQVGRELLDAFGSGTGDTSADHDYCSFPKQSLLTEHSQQVVTTVRQKLHSLDDQLSSKTKSNTEELDTILLLLENIDRYINGNLDEKDVTETVLALLKAKDWSCVYSSSLLCGVGRWLGQQFHAANSSISQKVEGFKVQHIERISDLHYIYASM